MSAELKIANFAEIPFKTCREFIAVVTKLEWEERFKNRIPEYFKEKFILHDLLSDRGFEQTPLPDSGGVEIAYYVWLCRRIPNTEDFLVACWYYNEVINEVMAPRGGIFGWFLDCLYGIKTVGPDNIVIRGKQLEIMGYVAKLLASKNQISFEDRTYALLPPQ
eukprot:TRINITY_DN11788_c0_g1_i1.p1 TRINITY_DN11788_c0_g1~~TRINITY_DN11788_c0_g1_i1.p1  ORF type:complete len:174 (+),score=16.65 TRINITY_DN11788_c0_g1_i1:36-524(+)